jgi:hypothetical protein
MEQGLETYDVVGCAMKNMQRETLEKIVRKHLESQVKDAIVRFANRGLSLEHARNGIAEKIQSNMPAEDSRNFSKELFDDTGIDARKPRLGGYRPASTIGHIDSIYMDTCNGIEMSRRNRKER